MYAGEPGAAQDMAHGAGSEGGRAGDGDGDGDGVVWCGVVWCRIRCGAVRCSTSVSKAKGKVSSARAHGWAAPTSQVTAAALAEKRLRVWTVRFVYSSSSVGRRGYLL